MAKRNRQIQDLEKARFGSRPSEANVWIDSGSRKGPDQDRVLRTSADGFWTRFGSRPNAICKQGGPLGEPLWRACDGPRCFSAPGARLRLRRVRAAPPTPCATHSPKARGAPAGCEALPQRTRALPAGCEALPQGAPRCRSVRSAPSGREALPPRAARFPAAILGAPPECWALCALLLGAPQQGAGMRSPAECCALPAGCWALPQGAGRAPQGVGRSPRLLGVPPGCWALP